MYIMNLKVMEAVSNPDFTVEGEINLALSKREIRQERKRKKEKEGVCQGRILWYNVAGKRFTAMIKLAQAAVCMLILPLHSAFKRFSRHSRTLHMTKEKHACSPSHLPVCLLVRLSVCLPSGHPAFIPSCLSPSPLSIFLLQN